MLLLCLLEGHAQKTFGFSVDACGQTGFQDFAPRRVVVISNPVTEFEQFGGDERFGVEKFLYGFDFISGFILSGGGGGFVRGYDISGEQLLAERDEYARAGLRLRGETFRQGVSEGLKDVKRNGDFSVHTGKVKSEK